jgi:hypothetical protein
MTDLHVPPSGTPPSGTPPGDPPPAGPAPGERPPEPEHGPGLLEEIREEIHDAVEHVPEPVRWTVRRIVWVAGLALAGLVLLALVTGVLFIMRRTDLVAAEATLLANQALAVRSDVHVTVQDIRGNPFTGVRLIAVRAEFRDGKSPPLLEAPVVRARYGLWSLATGGRGPLQIELEQPVFRLSRDADGKLRLPQWRGGPAGGGSGRAVDIHVTVRGGAVRLPGPPGGVEGLDLRASITTGRETRVRVLGLSFDRGPFDSRLLAMEGEAVLRDSLRVRIDRLVSPDLVLRARASMARGGRDVVAHAEVDRVRWSWLAKVFRNGVFDVPGEGRLVADAVLGERLRGTFRGDLTWDGLPIRGRGGFDFDTRSQLLKVEPIDAESPAGRLSGGRLRYFKQAWSLESAAADGDPSQWSAIGLVGWPQGRLNGRFRYQQDARKRGRLDAWLVASEIAGWRADAAQVRVEFVPEAPDSFIVDWARRGGDARLAGAAGDGGVWRGEYRIRDIPLDEWPDGRRSGLSGLMRSGAGTVEGRDGGLFVTGELAGTDSEWLGAKMARWTLSGVEGRLLPTPDLRTEARIEDALFLALHLDTTTAALQVGDQRVSLVDVRSMAGDTLITLAGESRWDAGGWALELIRASMSSPDFDWIAEPPLRLSGDPGGVSFERVIAYDGPARAVFGGRWAGPGGRYDWTGRGDALALDHLGLPEEFGLAGTADAELRVTGAYGDPRWTFEARVGHPGQGGHAADSLYLSLAGSPGKVGVRDMQFLLGGGRLTLEGEIGGMSPAWPETLTAGGVTAWLTGAQDWRGRARSVAFPLGRLGVLSAGAADWGGTLSGTLEFAGRPRAPELRLEATAEPLLWRGHPVDEVRARAQYLDGRLQVDQLRARREGVVSTAQGSLPLLLAADRPPELPDEPMSWRMQIPDGDLSILQEFVPPIGYAAGRFSLDAEIGGTARRPDLRGSARVVDGVVRMAAREEVLEKLRAEFTLAGDRVRLDSLSAVQGARGRVRGTGEIRLDGLALEGYRFDLQLREFTAAEAGYYAAQFDGDFEVVNGLERSGHTLPHVTGAALIRRAVILFDFANQSETEQLAATTQPLFWTYRVNLDAASNVHWQPPDGDIEFSCDLTAEQTLDSLLVYGELRALRGSYYFLSNRFTVRKADLSFDNLKGVDPLLDVEVDTQLLPGYDPDTDLPSSEPVKHTVTVRLAGRAREPTVTFSSDPDDWDENRILRELTLGRFYDTSGRVNLGDPLDRYLTQAINRQLSAELSRTFKGYINEWELERERGGLITGGGELYLTVGSQLTQELAVRVQQRVPGAARDYGQWGTPTDPFERAVEAEYRLSRFFYVTGELRQPRAVGGATSLISGAPTFFMNLKARWEY